MARVVIPLKFFNKEENKEVEVRKISELTKYFNDSYITTLTKYLFNDSLQNLFYGNNRDELFEGIKTRKAKKEDPIKILNYIAKEIGVSEFKSDKLSLAVIDSNSLTNIFKDGSIIPPGELSIEKSENIFIYDNCIVCGDGKEKSILIIKDTKIFIEKGKCLKLTDLCIKSNGKLIIINGNIYFKNVRFIGTTLVIAKNGVLNIENCSIEDVKIGTLIEEGGKIEIKGDIKYSNVESKTYVLNNSVYLKNKRDISENRIINKLSDFKIIREMLLEDIARLNNVFTKYCSISASSNSNKDQLKVEINAITEKLKSDNIKILILGEFSTGKSTFVNALLGNQILPVSVMPTTAAITIVKYSSEKKAIVYFSDNDKSKEININELENYTTSLSKEKDEMAKKIKKVEVFYPLEYCKNGVEIIDTPGLNSVNEYHEYITYSHLHQGHVGIFLLNARQPLSKSERKFLSDVTKDINKIKFVVNMIDTLDKEEFEESMSFIKDELRNILQKSEVDIYPLSAKIALKGDRDKSNFNNFIREFEYFLISDGKTKLIIETPIRQALDCIKKLNDNIEITLRGIKFSAEEYDKKLKELEEKIKYFQAEKNGIINYIKEQSNELRSRVSIKAKEIFYKYVNDIKQQIIAWPGDPNEFKKIEILRTIITPHLKACFEDIEELIKGEMNNINSVIEEKLKKIYLQINETRTYLLSNEDNSESYLSSSNVDVGQLSFLEVVFSAGLITALSTVFLGPIGLIVGAVGTFIYNVFRSDSVRQEALNKIAEHVEKKLIDYYNNAIKDTDEKIGNYYEEKSENIEKRIDSSITSMRESIVETRSLLEKDKMEFEKKVNSYKEIYNELIFLEYKIRDKVIGFLN